jgi:hypothetical protein
LTSSSYKVLSAGSGRITGMRMKPPGMKALNRFEGKKGVLLGPEPKTEAGHFYVCMKCRQAVDKRELGQVIHHMMPKHERLPTDS